MVKLRVKVLKTWAEKVNGLIGIKRIYPVFFETRFGIHTFGMKVPIDVLILNDDNEIVAVRKNLKPDRVFIWNPGYSKVLEIPVNFLKLKVGDKIKLQVSSGN